MCVACDATGHHYDGFPEVLLEVFRELRWRFLSLFRKPVVFLIRRPEQQQNEERALNICRSYLLCRRL
jgi:hypothetical protein